MEGYFDALLFQLAHNELFQLAHFEQHIFSANIHKVIKIPTERTIGEILNYPSRTIEKKLVQEGVQCGK